LTNRTEIHAVSLADKEQDSAGIGEMRRLFRSYTPVFWSEAAKFSPAFYAEFLVKRFTRFPYFLAKYRVPEFRQAVESLAACERFDLILCDFLQSAVALLGSDIHPRVVFEHNVEYVIRERHWELETNPLRKWLLRAEWEKARAVEREVCRAFDHVITVSEQDRLTLMRDLAIPHVSALPTGVDLEFFHPSQVELRRGNLVFVGSLDWHPNEDGIVWFVREVYPHIRWIAPYISLTVVGRKPSARLRALTAADPSVEITGTVEDVRPFLARAEVVVVPLRIGGGSRIKIFEAMAMARPVVSTTVGAEGLPVFPEREILLADEPQDFAQAVLTLLGDTSRREVIASAGREKVLRDHSWETVAAKMEEVLKQVASAARQKTEATIRASQVKTEAMLAG